MGNEAADGTLDILPGHESRADERMGPSRLRHSDAVFIQFHRVSNGQREVMAKPSGKGAAKEIISIGYLQNDFTPFPRTIWHKRHYEGRAIQSGQVCFRDGLLRTGESRSPWRNKYLKRREMGLWGVEDRSDGWRHSTKLEGRWNQRIRRGSLCSKET